MIGLLQVCLSTFISLSSFFFFLGSARFLQSIPPSSVSRHTDPALLTDVELLDDNFDQDTDLEEVLLKEQEEMLARKKARKAERAKEGLESTKLEPKRGEAEMKKSSTPPRRFPGGKMTKSSSRAAVTAEPDMLQSVEESVTEKDAITVEARAGMDVEVDGVKEMIEALKV